MIKQYVVLLIGITASAIGLLATFFPKWMSEKFGVPAGRDAIPYVISTGIRDVFIGLTVLVSCYRQEWTIVGVICLGIAGVAVSDFIVVRKYGNKIQALTHLLGAIAALACALWILP